MRFLLVAFALIALACGSVAGWEGLRLRQARAALAARTPGLVDVRFAQFMVLHHEQALLLSQIVLGDPASRLGPLARGVQTQQLREQSEMIGWLKLWGEPSVPAEHSMYWLLQAGVPLDADTRQYLLDCQRAPSGMAGMASNEELQRLRTAQGPARDALFLQLMRRHHEGGLPMARFAARTAHLPVVRDLAGRILMEQQEEVMGMRMAQLQLTAPTTGR